MNRDFEQVSFSNSVLFTQTGDGKLTLQMMDDLISTARLKYPSCVDIFTEGVNFDELCYTVSIISLMLEHETRRERPSNMDVFFVCNNSTEVPARSHKKERMAASVDSREGTGEMVTVAKKRMRKES